MRGYWSIMVALVAGIAACIYFVAASSGWADDLGEQKIVPPPVAVVKADDELSSAVKVCSNLTCKTEFGSGVSIGDGYFLTARHVAVSHIDGFEWTMKADNGRVFKATVIWQMGDSDLALMKVVRPVNAAVFVFPSSEVNCDELERGQIVTAIGNPEDMAFVHVDGKIISQSQDLGFWKDAFALDMQVYGGFSGGPVFNTSGEVVGIVVGMLGETSYSIMEPITKLCGLLPTAEESEVTPAPTP